MHTYLHFLVALNDELLEEVQCFICLLFPVNVMAQGHDVTSQEC